MAGVDPTGSFDAASYRAAIESTMLMGLPNAVALRPTFRWIVQGNYALGGPSGTVPYDLNEASSGPAPLSISDMQANCAVQYLGGAEEGTLAGFENAIQVVLTLLDTDWNALLAHGKVLRPSDPEPDQVLLADATYTLDRMTQMGLFSVDVFQLYGTAVDQP